MFIYNQSNDKRYGMLPTALLSLGQTHRLETSVWPQIKEFDIDQLATRQLAASGRGKVVTGGKIRTISVTPKEVASAYKIQNERRAAMPYSYNDDDDLEPCLGPVAAMAIGMGAQQALGTTGNLLNAFFAAPELERIKGAQARLTAAQVARNEMNLVALRGQYDIRRTQAVASLRLAAQNGGTLIHHPHHGYQIG
jgi:hypothetical protein